MKQKQKPLSFSLNPLNIEYIESVVSKQKEVNSRYNRSTYMDDLITHLRNKARSKKEIAIVGKEKAPVKRFKAPTPKEVFEYMLTRNTGSIDEAQSFCDFYESNGWKVGKNKMKCWKASVRNWLKGSNKANNKKDILEASSSSDWHLQDQGF